MATPGFLCGGVIATLLDCHCLNTANALQYKESGREIGTKPIILYITGAIQVKLLRPTPLNRPVVLRARIKNKQEKKIVLACSVYSGKNQCARGEIVAIRVPEALWIK